MVPVGLISPYSGDVVGNLQYTRQCMLDCLGRGEAPLPPHALYTQVLDDAEPEQRKIGMFAGRAWWLRCDRVVVYTDKGTSAGMESDINWATGNGLKVEFRKLLQ